MAGVLMPNVGLTVSTAGGQSIGDVVPAGKYESVCLMACLSGGTADSYVSVYNQTEFLVQNEPVRYRQPGGSPLLLLDFIIGAGTVIGVQIEVLVPVNFLLFNRWRQDY